MDLLPHLSGFTVLLILGLRHGLDPDHITIIDGYTYRLHERKSLWTSWVGTLFAFGHGLMVTVIALALSLIRNNFELPPVVSFMIDWIPVVMLLFIGIMNVISLSQHNEFRTKSLKKWMLPAYFNSHLNPLSVILTGIIFGFIFDTSTQIAAFGFALSAADQWVFAVAGGIVFSAGLMITGTFDSFYLSRLLKKFDQKNIKTHRYRLNVLITCMCFIIPFYKLLCTYNQNFELTDFQNNIAGIAFILAIVLIYVDLYIKYLRTPKSDRAEHA
jgi:high-affinity nickel-transport protein